MTLQLHLAINDYIAGRKSKAEVDRFLMQKTRSYKKIYLHLAYMQVQTYVASNIAGPGSKSATG